MILNVEEHQVIKSSMSVYWWVSFMLIPVK